MSDAKETTSERMSCDAPFFELEVPGGGRLEFQNQEGLIEWLEDDLSKREELARVVSRNILRDPNQDLLAPLRGYLQNLKSTGDSTHVEVIRNFIRDSRYVPADSARGRYLEGLARTTSALTAAYAYVVWTMPGSTIKLHNQQRATNLPVAAPMGVALAAMFDTGAPDPKALRATYSRVLENFDKELTVMRAETERSISSNDSWLTDEGNALIDRHERLAADHEAKLTDLATRDAQRERTWAGEVESLQGKVRELEELLAAQKAEHEGVAATAREELEKIESLRETLHKRIVTEAPVQNWSDRAAEAGDKAETARKGAIGFGVAFLAYLVGVGFFFIFAKEVKPHQAGAALVIAVALAWPVRFFLKLYLSSRHMQSEASERVAMTKTFVALADNESMKPDQHLLVLQALFRPTNTGLIGGDAMPPGVYDLLSKWLAKGSGSPS